MNKIKDWYHVVLKDLGILLVITWEDEEVTISLFAYQLEYEKKIRQIQEKYGTRKKTGS